MITRVLEKTVATVRARGMMYEVVAQSLLLYGSESWVVMGSILKLLERFQHWAPRRIIGMTATSRAGGERKYP